MLHTYPNAGVSEILVSISLGGSQCMTFPTVYYGQWDLRKNEKCGIVSLKWNSGQYLTSTETGREVIVFGKDQQECDLIGCPHAGNLVANVRGRLDSRGPYLRNSETGARCLRDQTK